MNISYNWLKNYIDVDLPVEELSQILTDIGLEVEGVQSFQSVKGGLQGVVVGEVLTCHKHPNADKLSVTTVNVGQDVVLPIVCGAPNVAAGKKVAVATPGTTLYSGDDAFVIKKTKIRGEVSEGMICAEDELGLGDSHEGIMVLDASLKPGMPLSSVFDVVNDVIFEIGLTPNRIDGVSHYGVARDLAAFLSQKQQTKASLPSVDAFKVDSNSRSCEVLVENSEACPRYAGLTITGVTVKESPDWMKNALKAIGQKSINNVVDVTNYVLHEMAQPLHAFDLTKVKGDKVVVRNMPEGTPFVTLDEVERKLSSEDLMICNEKEGMCIAGVFGGIDSGVTEQTTEVFLESAYFNPVSIRKTAKRHGLSTDASFRFERGIDPNIQVYALKRAALLIQELAGGTVTSDIIDVYPQPVEPAIVELSYEYVDKLIGEKIDRQKIKNILLSLEFTIEKEDDQTLLLKVPPYRVDVLRPADVVEEILRIYGYNQIPVSEQLHTTLPYSNKKKAPHQIRSLISEMLTANGFHEIMCNSLTKKSYYENTPVKEQMVEIVNPLSQDLGVLRQTLLFGGLESIAYNINRKNTDLLFYEFGNTYFLGKQKNEDPHSKYTEKEVLALFITGNKEQHTWHQQPRLSSFFTLKGYAELVLRKMGFEPDDLVWNSLENTFYAADGLACYVGEKPLVSLMMVKREVLQALEIDKPVYYAEFDWQLVLKKAEKNHTRFSPIPKYPGVSRDLAMLIDKQVTFNQIVDLARKTEKKLLRNIVLFDVFEDEKKLGAGKKSYAVNFILRDDDKTLKDKQVDKVMNGIMKACVEELGAQIR